MIYTINKPIKPDVLRIKIEQLREILKLPMTNIKVDIRILLVTPQAKQPHYSLEVLHWRT